jgi:hypothetical protein
MKITDKCTLFEEKLKELYYNELQTAVLIPYHSSECCVKWV